LSKLKQILNDLRVNANAKAALVVDNLGEPVAVSGDCNSIDSATLAGLVGSNFNAVEGLAKLIGQKEFSILFHEGDLDNIHVQLVSQHHVLAVVFTDRDGLGRVRLHAKSAVEALERLLASDGETRPPSQDQSGGGETPGSAAAGLYWRQRGS
jgi:predicted regulator of Ras-like GTPase activity (Roadblock/LC7/MglB family)